MLCFFFCSEGPVYWEILGEGETVDSALFRKQPEEMEARVPSSYIRQNKIMFLDNSRPHHTNITQQKLKDVEIEWLQHPPYSSDICPCESRAFRNLENFCRGRALKEPQGSGVPTAASRLLEERTRETARTMKNNCENTRKVLRRSQECLNC